MAATPRPYRWTDHLVQGLSAYAGTSLIVVLGVLFGHAFVRPPPGRPDARDGPLLECFLRHDGQNYKRIVEDGYSYDTDRRSLVAFFPAYPLAARLVKDLTGCRTEVALLLVSNLCLAATFVLLHLLALDRFGQTDPRIADYTVLAFGLFPTTFFFRMAYSEGLFLLLLVLFMLGMQRRWPLLVLALLCGAATGARPVGVALVPAFAWHVCRREQGLVRRVAALLFYLPLASGGLLAYMFFQQAAFETPIAFAAAQEHWSVALPAPSSSKTLSLLTFEPFWGPYISGSPRSWNTLDPAAPSLLLSLAAMNPFFFLGMLFLLTLGCYRGELTAEEVLLGLGLLVIPYLTRSYDMAMLSSGRFAAAVVPSYLAVGRLAKGKPAVATALVLALLAVLLDAYTSLYAAGWPNI